MSEIRNAQGKDIRWAVHQEFELLPEVDPAFKPDQMSGMRRFLLRQVVLPQNYRRHLKGWMAWQNDERVGFQFVRKGLISVFIESLGVLKPYQRQGIGTQLLEHAEAFANEQERAILSASVTRENLPARAFFQKQGFQAYRSGLLTAETISLELYPPGKKVLQELSAREIVQVYERWLLKAIRAGDPDWEHVIWEEHRKLALHTTARHWLIQEGEEELGYLRISGLSSRMTVYLNCLPEYWQTDRPWHWIHAALETYPYPPEILHIDLASSRQFDESRRIFEKIGFEAGLKDRFLLFKQSAG